MADPKLHSLLRTRLVEVLAMEPNEPFTEETARAAITGFCEGAVCCRWPQVDGRARTFEAVFEAIYGKKLDGSVARKMGVA